jgi:hypothetical protein
LGPDSLNIDRAISFCYAIQKHKLGDSELRSAAAIWS